MNSANFFAMPTRALPHRELTCRISPHASGVPHAINVAGPLAVWESRMVLLCSAIPWWMGRPNSSKIASAPGPDLNTTALSRINADVHARTAALLEASENHPTLSIDPADTFLVNLATQRNQTALLLLHNADHLLSADDRVAAVATLRRTIALFPDTPAATRKQATGTTRIAESVMNRSLVSILLIASITSSLMASSTAPSNTVKATRVIHFEGSPQICAGIINGINSHMVAYPPVNDAVTAASGIPLGWIGQILSMSASPVSNEITIAIDLSKPVGPSPDNYPGPREKVCQSPLR